MKVPLIIGITGGIGSGKSTLSKKLCAEGYLVYDSDIEARKLQNEHPLIRKQLIELFGEDIYNSSGLNRAELAKLVFGNNLLMSKLNSIVHPIVKEDIDNWKIKHVEQHLLFLESAILFECGFDSLVDKVILMTASDEVRIARVIKRDGVTVEQVRARMAHQLPDIQKRDKSDFIIYSDDNQPLIDKMHRILEELKKRTHP